MFVTLTWCVFFGCATLAAALALAVFASQRLLVVFFVQEAVQSCSHQFFRSAVCFWAGLGGRAGTLASQEIFGWRCASSLPWLLALAS